LDRAAPTWDSVGSHASTGESALMGLRSSETTWPDPVAGLRAVSPGPAGVVPASPVPRRPRAASSHESGLRPDAAPAPAAGRVPRFRPAGAAWPESAGGTSGTAAGTATGTGVSGVTIGWAAVVAAREPAENALETATEAPTSARRDSGDIVPVPGEVITACISRCPQAT